MKKVIILLISLIILLPIASANVTVEPETIHLDLIASQNTTKALNITWTGENPVILFLNTNITPEGKGITVSYTPTVLLLYPEETKTVEMLICTNIALSPGEYELNTTFSTEFDDYYKNKIDNIMQNLSNHSKQITELLDELTLSEENLTTLDELNLQLQNTIDELENLKNDLETAIDELENTINALEQQLADTDKKEEANCQPYFLVTIGIIIIIATILYYFFIQNKKKQTQKSTKSDRKRGSTGPKNK